MDQLTTDDLALLRGAQDDALKAQGALEYVSGVIARKYQIKQGDMLNPSTGAVTRKPEHNLKAVE